MNELSTVHADEVAVHADKLALFHHVGDGSKFVDVSNLLDGGNLVKVTFKVVLLVLPSTDHLFELVSSDSLLEQFLGLVHFLHLVKFLDSAQELEFGLGLVRATEASISGDVASDVAHVEDLCVAGHGHGGSHGAGWAQVDDVARLLDVDSLGSGGG